MFNIRRKKNEWKGRKASGKKRPEGVSSRGFIMLGLTLGMLLASLDHFRVVAGVALAAAAVSLVQRVFR